MNRPIQLNASGQRRWPLDIHRTDAAAASKTRADLGARTHSIFLDPRPTPMWLSFHQHNGKATITIFLFINIMESHDDWASGSSGHFRFSIAVFDG
jgi:hypothetical protein